MASAILLTVQLKGQIKGPEKHIDKQIVSVDVSPIGAKQPDFIHKKIKHNDRLSMECTRKTRISEEVVTNWENSECPFWEKPSHWKTMNKLQKITSYINRHDEGYGVSFDFVDNN
jgi:hypothetical protein